MVVYRDSLTHTMRRIFSYKLVLLSVILMVIGLFLFVLSLQSNSIVTSNYVQTGSTIANNATYSEVYFGQYSHLKSNIDFTIPGSAVVHYSIYKVNNYSSDYKLKTQTVFVTSGTAYNNSVVSVDATKLPQGQEYVLKVESLNGIPVPVHVYITESVHLTEEANRATGGPGVMFGMAGSMLLSANIARLYKGMKAI